MGRKVVRILVLTLIALFILSLFGIRFEHPRAGLSTGLGGASSTLAIVQRASTYADGDRILVSIKGGNEKSPTLGVVRGVTQTDYLVQLDKSVVTIARKDVVGHELVLFPFLGYIFSIIGL